MPIISYTVTKEVSEEALATINDREEYAFTCLVDPYLFEDAVPDESIKLTMTFGDTPDIVYDFETLRLKYDSEEGDSDE